MPTKPSNHGATPPPRRRPAASLPTGRLILSGLTGFGYHGNNPAERKLGQTFTVDLEVMLDTQRAATSDRIDETVSYPMRSLVAALWVSSITSRSTPRGRPRATASTRPSATRSWRRLPG